MPRGNFEALRDDHDVMRCEPCRDSLSALLDDEDPGHPIATLDAHLAECAGCRRFSLEIADVHRRVRVREAEPVPDLTQSILDAAPPPAATTAPSPRPVAARSVLIGWLRYGLVVIGLTMLTMAVPSLVLHDTGSAIHATRELSAWDLAFGAGLVFAAWRPGRARGLLPTAAVLVAGQLLGSAIDVANGRSMIVNEAHHVLELVGVLLLWWLCRVIDPTPAERIPSLRSRLHPA
jgi:predicted anti-sigma-YlaC factor YlaD